jgi:hypothetical protein
MLNETFSGSQAIAAVLTEEGNTLRDSRLLLYFGAESEIVAEDRRFHCR